MHKNSEAVFNKYSLKYFQPGMSVMEVGPERQAYTKRTLDNMLGKENYTYYYSDLSKEYMYNTVSDHWGIRSTEIDTLDMPHFIPMKNENEFECESDRFDIVFATNVIEHVRMPWLWIGELKRITKPGGYIILECPGISTQYHEAPIDCWRIWPHGFEALYEYNDLELLESCTDHVMPEPDGYQHIDTIAIGRKNKLN